MKIINNITNKYIYTVYTYTHFRWKLCFKGRVIVDDKLKDAKKMFWCLFKTTTTL